LKAGSKQRKQNYPPCVPQHPCRLHSAVYFLTAQNTLATLQQYIEMFLPMIDRRNLVFRNNQPTGDPSLGTETNGTKLKLRATPTRHATRLQDELRASCTTRRAEPNECVK
ncbi:hypothetical protein OAF83_03970, partial [Rubripirellula sp.]